MTYKLYLNLQSINNVLRYTITQITSFVISCKRNGDIWQKCMTKSSTSHELFGMRVASKLNLFSQPLHEVLTKRKQHAEAEQIGFKLVLLRSGS